MSQIIRCDSGLQPAAERVVRGVCVFYWGAKHRGTAPVVSGSEPLQPRTARNSSIRKPSCRDSLVKRTGSGKYQKEWKDGGKINQD